MRRFNAVLSAAILALFLIHGVAGGLQLLGLRPASQAMRVLAWTAVGLIVIHVVIGIVLTARSIGAAKKAGASYPGLNALFWARRLSGLAVMVLLLFHLTAFGDSSGPLYRLAWFTRTKRTFFSSRAMTSMAYCVSQAGLYRLTGTV